MKQFIKSLFLPLAVFAMLGLGVLTLSASNVTTEVVTNSEVASMQSVYMGDLYIVDATQASGFRKVTILPRPEHCTFDDSSNIPCTAIIDGVTADLYGEVAGPPVSYEPLYKI
ncbi:hypothetical protein ACYSNM_12960 [Myroides sp. LJL116]